MELFYKTNLNTMDLQPLQNRLVGIQNYLDDFRKRLVNSELHYQASLKLLTDPVLSSALMERHILLMERQKTSISRMEVSQKRVKLLLERLSKSSAG